MIVAMLCSLLVLGYLGVLCNDARRFRRHLARAEAARAAEAPCEGLSHVRLIPQDQSLPEAELSPEDDLCIRMVDALNSFAERNGYEVPAPALWLALGTVVADAILGEDLAAVLWGPGVPGGDAS
jgi:hypothetical protein